MSNKNIAIGTVLVLVTFITLIALTFAFATLPSINLTAAFAAITVAVIGIAWFKRSAK